MSAVDFVICGGLTAAGLVLSYFRWRRKGPRSGFRLAAWSLLPLAAYLTGTVTLIRQISTAVVHFGGSFVFSTKTWAGVVLAGIAVAMLLTSGGIPLTGRRKRKKAAPAGSQPAVVPGGGAGKAALEPGSPSAAKKGKRGAAPADDDLADVEEILRRRGIS
jgi:hypothetical protein